MRLHHVYYDKCTSNRVLDSVNKHVTLYVFWISIDNSSGSIVDNNFRTNIK